MGFFSELKSDLSQAVNTMLPEEDGQTAADAPEKEQTGKVSLNEMLDHLDDIKLDRDILKGEQPEDGKDQISAGEKESDKQMDDSAAELAKAVEAIQSEEKKEAEAESSIVNETAAEEPAGSADDMANLEALEQMSRSKVEEQLKQEAEYEASRQKKRPENRTVNTGGITMDIQQQTPTDETGSITEGMMINGDLSTTGSLDLVGKIVGNVTCLGKLNITGEITGDSKAAEIYAEAARITGEVNSQGSVKIGQSTVVVGNLFATSAVIAGAVKGDIDVHGPVVLDTTAIVMGNIKSQSVQINNGAVIEGIVSQTYAEVNPSAFFDGLKSGK